MKRIKHTVADLKRSITALLLYCLPCIIALALILHDYHTRVDNVSDQIKKYGNSVLEQEGDTTSVLVVKDSVATRLVQFFETQRDLGRLSDESIKSVDGQINKIWIRNTLIIGVMVMLPFFLLGSALAFNRNNRLDPSDLMDTAKQNWLMKFIIACVMAVGWIYIVNPLGRGATTVEEFLISENSVVSNSLPVYISAENGLGHTVVGFLGWYLHLLLYFFRKLHHNDVVSSRVYRFLFGKLLFTYGIALTLSSVMGNEGQVALFLIGFFPLSALSMIKEYVFKSFSGLKDSKGGISLLPGIANWQILRLEEEGIDGVSSLASYDPVRLKRLMPILLSPMINLWIDCAKLVVILGEERFTAVKSICQTAEAFKTIVEEGLHDEKLIQIGIENPQSVVDLLNSTFPNNNN